MFRRRHLVFDDRVPFGTGQFSHQTLLQFEQLIHHMLGRPLACEIQAGRVGQPSKGEEAAMPGGERTRAPLQIEELELVQQPVDREHRRTQASMTPLLQPGGVRGDPNICVCPGDASAIFGRHLYQAAHGTKDEATQEGCRRTCEQFRAAANEAVVSARSGQTASWPGPTALSGI